MGVLHWMPPRCAASMDDDGPGRAVDQRADRIHERRPGRACACTNAGKPVGGNHRTPDGRPRTAGPRLADPGPQCAGHQHLLPPRSRVSTSRDWPGCRCFAPPPWCRRCARTRRLAGGAEMAQRRGGRRQEGLRRAGPTGHDRPRARWSLSAPGSTSASPPPNFRWTPPPAWGCWVPRPLTAPYCWAATCAGWRTCSGPLSGRAATPSPAPGRLRAAPARSAGHRTRRGAGVSQPARAGAFGHGDHRAARSMRTCPTARCCAAPPSTWMPTAR